MALKNITRLPANHHGIKSLSLIDDSGEKVPSFEYFAQHLASKGFPWTTRQAYLSAVAKFIDYLYEADVFAIAGISKAKLNAVVDLYTTILARGKLYDWRTFAAQANDDALIQRDLDWLPDVVAALDIPPNGLRPTSFDNRIAGINHYLHLCEAFRDEMLSSIRPNHLNGAQNWLDPLITSVAGTTTFSEKETRQIQHASVLGAVIRFSPSGIRRPAGMKNPLSNRTFLDVMRLDFPIVHFKCLLDACTTYRDRCLWLLLLGTGIRSSEAKNLRWIDVETTSRKIWVSDPKQLRYGDQMTAEEYQRFKGRTYSMTYFIKPLRDEFFAQLEQYLSHEYTGPCRDSDHVFQFLRDIERWGIRRGDPLITISDEGFIGLFKRATERAKIPTPRHLPNFNWTPHSLRHAYGVYMRNYFRTGELIPQADGSQKERLGLLTEEVQKLMGHESIKTTEHYARQKRDTLLNTLEAADRRMLDYHDDPLTDISPSMLPCDPNLLPETPKGSNSENPGSEIAK